MEEGTIFQGQAANQNPLPQRNQSEAIAPQPSNPVTASENPSTTPSAPAAEPQPSNNPYAFKNASNPPPIPGNHKSKILKILVIVGVILFILIILMFVLSLLKSGKSNKSQGIVTLNYWGTQEDPSVINPVIADFEKENPNIKVVYTKQDPSDYRERITARIGNGNNPPDVFKFHNTWYPMFKNILLPLPKETIEKTDFQNNYYDVAQNDLIKNGAIYGIPLEIDTLSMFINSDLMNANGDSIPVPTTWQEFINASQKLTQRDENGKISVAGAAIGTYENVKHAPDIISLLFVQNGVDMNNFTASDRKVSDALSFYTNFALIENNVWDDTLDDSILAFSQGKAAMVFGYSSDYFAIKTTNPNLNFEVKPVPQLVNNSPVNFASYWADGVSSASKHQNEALLFMKFLGRKDTQEKLFAQASKVRQFGEPYSIKSLADKLSDSPEFVFVNQAKTAKSSPFVDSTNDNGLNNQLDNLLKDAVNATLENKSDSTTIQTLFDGYNQVIGQYSGNGNN